MALPSLKKRPELALMLAFLALATGVGALAWLSAAYPESFSIWAKDRHNGDLLWFGSVVVLLGPGVALVFRAMAALRDVTATSQTARRGENALAQKLVNVGFIFMIFGSGFLPLSFYIRETLHTSVGGSTADYSGKVFVSKGSEAAKRGYALPGEGRTAFLVSGQMERSTRIRWVAVGEFLFGYLLIVSGALLPPRRPLAAFFAPLWSLQGLFYGGLLGVLLVPTKLLDDAVFDMFLAVCVMVSGFVAFRRRGHTMYPFLAVPGS